MPTLDLNTPLGQQLLRARGRLESGELANMRTYRLPRDVKGHVRVLGASRTLCGRPLHGHLGRWAWQFIHRGQFGLARPAHVTCRTCTRVLDKAEGRA